MAAMACIPPTLQIVVTPQRDAAYKIAGCICPFLSGGEHSTISLHPAILAGIANMSTVENNGALPPGMYKPTRDIGRFSIQQSTPALVLTRMGPVFWAAWKA
jgi:hypothetical protein